MYQWFSKQKLPDLYYAEVDEKDAGNQRLEIDRLELNWVESLLYKGAMIHCKAHYSDTQ